LGSDAGVVAWSVPFGQRAGIARGRIVLIAVSRVALGAVRHSGAPHPRRSARMTRATLELMPPFDWKLLSVGMPTHQRHREKQRHPQGLHAAHL
jgi:hypothetical protein